MKKISIALWVFLLVGITHSFSQTSTAPAPTPVMAVTPTPAKDFFAGKWEIMFLGTPNGDVKLIATLVRKDGQLTGEMIDATGTRTEAIPITSIEEGTTKITLGFSAEGYELTADLEKVDDDNLKGMLINMFESKATRVKESKN